MLMKVWFLPSLWLLLLGGHHEFIFHLFSSLSSSRQVCALPFPSWNFKCFDNNCARQADWAGGVKIQMLCMWQTQRRPFCGLRFDLIRWEIKWHLTGCQIMPSVIFGCISWMHSPCLTWGNHPEVCQKWHWISRPQGNNMDISMEKAMSLSLTEAPEREIWECFLLHLLSIWMVKWLYFVQMGCSVSHVVQWLLFLILSLTNTEWMSAAKLAGFWLACWVNVLGLHLWLYKWGASWLWIYISIKQLTVTGRAFCQRFSETLNSLCPDMGDSAWGPFQTLEFIVNELLNRRAVP